VVTLAGTALVGVGLDQATKALMVATVEGKPPVHLIGRVLTVDVSRNSGAASPPHLVRRRCSPASL
jgi:lipoprotein signal peptidase